MLFPLIRTLVQPSRAASSNPAQACPEKTGFQLVEEQLLAPQKHWDQSPAITPHTHICTHTHVHTAHTHGHAYTKPERKKTKSQVL